MKRFIRGRLGGRADSLYTPVYSLIAGVTLIPLAYVFLKDPGPVLYIVPSPWRYLMVAGMLAAGFVSVRGFKDAPGRFRLEGQLSSPGTMQAGELEIKGVYKWIRDPFTFSALGVMILTPFMTVNLLVIYVMTLIYVSIGTLHWESRLVAQYGEDYRKYQKRVGRIIPRRH